MISRGSLTVDLPVLPSPSVEVSGLYHQVSLSYMLVNNLSFCFLLYQVLWIKNNFAFREELDFHLKLNKVLLFRISEKFFATRTESVGSKQKLFVTAARYKGHLESKV